MDLVAGEARYPELKSAQVPIEKLTNMVVFLGCYKKHGEGERVGAEEDRERERAGESCRRAEVFRFLVPVVEFFFLKGLNRWLIWNLERNLVQTYNKYTVSFNLPLLLLLEYRHSGEAQHALHLGH